MRYIIKIFVLLALCGSAFAQGTPPYIGKWKISGTFIYNCKGDSAAVIVGTDTTWFGANVIRRGLDTVSELGPAIEGDELGTGLKDSITNGQTAYGWDDHSGQGYVDTAELHDTAEVLRGEMTSGAGGWTDQDPYIILEAIGDSVGIGTATPDAKLEVVGEIKTDTLIVTEVITLPNNSISDEELDEGANFIWTGSHTYRNNVSLDAGVGNSPSIFYRDGDNHTLMLLKHDDGYSVIHNNEGELRFIFSNDASDYIYMDTFVADVPMISTGGACDLVINASSGEIGFGDENLTTTGTLDAGATSVTGNITVSGTVDGRNLSDDEWLEDEVGEMLGGTQTGITVTYQDGTDDIDFEVDVTVSDSTAAVADSAVKVDTTTYTNVWVHESGDTMSGVLDMGTHKITHVVDPTENQDAATKKYVDDEVGEAGGGDITNVVGKGGIIDDSSGTGTISIWLNPGFGIDTTMGGTTDSVFVDTVGLNANWKIATASSADEADTAASSADEKVQDKVGAMVTGNTETQITVTYQDDDGTIDFVIDDPMDSADGSERATKDGDGSTISTTYMKRSGGTVTGAWNWGDQNITNVERGDFDTLAVESLGVSQRFEIDGETFTGLKGTGLINDGGVLSVSMTVSDTTADSAVAAGRAWQFMGDSLNVDHIVSSNVYLGNDSLKGLDVIVVDTVTVDGDVIKDFTGTNLSVTDGVLNAAGGGNGTSVEILEANVSKDDPLVILNLMAGFDVSVVNDTSYVTIDLTEDQVVLTTEVTGTLPVNKGGTGAATLTDHAILIGSGTDAVSNPGVLSSGQLLIGYAGADPSAATLTEGEAIDVGNAAGSITISAEDATSANKGVVTFAAIRDTADDVAEVLIEDSLNEYSLTSAIVAGYLAKTDSGTWDEVAAKIILNQVVLGNASDSGVADSNAATRGYVEKMIEDSLNEYSLTSAIASLYPDTAETVDTIQGILVDYVTDANLTDTLNSYFDSAVVVDTILSSLLDANIPDGITITQASDVDSTGTDISAALGNRIGLLIELFAYLDRTYFDTAADAGGDSIIVAYSDSTDLSVFDSDDLTEGASNLYNQTHTGDVTGSVALTIAANIIDTSDMAHAPLGKLIRDTITAEGYITGNESITLSGDVSGSGATAITTTIGASKIDSLMLNFTEIDEWVSDQVLEVLDGGTQTGITVTAQDGTNDMDFVVDTDIRQHTLDTTEVLDILRDSISGDATVGAAGALTIAANAVESTMIGADQVNDLDINFGAGTDQVNSDDLPAHTGDVTGGTALTIAANAVESTMIGADQVNDLDINFGTGTDQVSPADFANEDVGDMSISTGSWTLDNDVVAPDEMADADHGDFTYSTGVATLDAGVVADNEIDYSAVTLADFDYQTAYRTFYSNVDGDVTELAHGTDGKVLTSGGASVDPTWETPAGVWDWADSAGEPPFWVDSATYASQAGAIDPFIPGKLTVTGPIDRYNFKLELDTTNIYCAHADTFLKLPIDTSEIGHVYDTFQMMHPSILYIPDPDGKFGYKYWIAGTPPQGLGENVHILVSHDEETWTEFVSGSDTLYNPVFTASDFTDGDNLSDPDIVWDENGDLHLVFRLQRTINGMSIFYLYAASTTDGIDWTDTTLMIDGFYNKGSVISPDTGTLKLLSPGVIMRGAGDYLMYTGEDTTDAQTGEKLRCAWVAPRIDTLWDNISGFDETYLFGSPILVGDTIRVSVTNYTMPAGNKLYHTDEIVYSSDLMVSLYNADSGATYPRIYMAVSTDGEYFTTVMTPLLATTNDAGSWDHTYLYRASGYWIVRDGKVILVMYYCAKSDAGDWFTGITHVHFGDVLHKREALIWNPDVFTDTLRIFYVDSTIYPGGIQIHSLEVQTSEDGEYALKLFSFTAADPPVLHDYIDTLNVGASDQRKSSKEVEFEDDEASLIDRGQFLYMLTPDTDIDWINMTFKFYVRDWK